MCHIEILRKDGVINVAKTKPNVVVIGGGTGMPVILRGLKHYPIKLSALVTVADDGGSSGRLRSEFDIPAPGDIRNVIAALSDVEPVLEDLFQYRFKVSNGLSGHSLGNVLLTAMASMTGDFHRGIERLSQILNVKGDIIPIVNESVTLCAEMEDESIVEGESNIPNSNKKIKRVFLKPTNLKPAPNVLNVIEEADLIVISPGSLYTSILPNLIIPHVAEAIKSTSAQVVYVCNVMTQDGETTSYKASNHIKAIYDHVGDNFIDSVIVHNEPIKKSVIKRYAEEKAEPVINDITQLRRLKLNVIERDIVDYNQLTLRHDTKKIGTLLYDIARKSMKT